MSKIRAPFGAYMLAVILLELLKLAAKDRDVDTGYNVTFEQKAISSLADAAGENVQAAQEFEDLLREMLSAHPLARPVPSDLVSRLGLLCRKFSEGSSAAETSIMRLIGAVAVPG